MKTQSALDRFDLFFAEQGEGLYRFCYRLTGNRSEAEDIAQEAFLAALIGKDRFQDRSSVKTWLYRIAFFKAKDRRRAHQSLENMDQAVNSAESMDSKLALDEAIRSLPEKLRVAFILVKVEQLSCVEAAEVLKEPVGTVKYHVFQAVRQLRADLAGCGWESGETEEEPYAM